MKSPSIQPFTFPPVHEGQNIAKINVSLTIRKQFKEYPRKIMGDYDQHCKTQKGRIVHHIRMQVTGMNDTWDKSSTERFKNDLSQGCIKEKQHDP
jgi:hypothetical protein